MTSFSWEEYISFAEALIQRADEASARIATSRAYYAMLNQAAKYLKVHHGPDVLDRASAKTRSDGSRRGSHEIIWDLIAKESDDAIAKLAVLADRLKKRREAADYDDVWASWKQDGPDTVRRARGAFDAFRTKAYGTPPASG